MKRSVLSAFYPETRIDGFCRTDHRIVFFNQVNAILRPEMSVLDFGAGRGKWSESESGYRLALTTLRGKCREVIGTDVDDAVLENQLIDKGIVTDPSEPLPFADNRFDLILSWAVFEHIEDPLFVASELIRVLKPGGWICAWTPSKWSYYAIAARVVPNKYHARIVKLTDGGARRDEDVFPTVYKLNTLSTIARYFPTTKFENCSYYYNGPPKYHANKRSLIMLWRLWAWLLPSPFSQQIHAFLRKRHENQPIPYNQSRERLHQHPKTHSR